MELDAITLVSEENDKVLIAHQTINSDTIAKTELELAALQKIAEEDEMIDKGDGEAQINFEQEPNFYSDFLIGMCSAGFSYIPYLGNLVGDISGFMNQPCAMRKGVRQVSLDYFINIAQYVCYMLSSYFYVFGNNVYIIMMVLLVIFAVFDCFEEGKDLIPQSKKIEIWDIFRCCCRKKKGRK